MSRLEAFMRTRNRLWFAVAAMMVAAGGAQPACAQIIHGQVVDGSTQAPIQGAFVILLDSVGTQRSAVLSGEGGRFVLRVPAPGSYVLRAERIGYADMLSDTLRVAQGEALSYHFAITVKPVSLAGLKVVGRGRCSMSRETGTETSVLWNEVRKALSIAVWGEQERGVPHQEKVWSRTRDLTSLELSADTTHVKSGYGRTPFISESAQKLDSTGYVQRLADGDYMFYGLDAKTLLSDDFLDTHCFRTVKPRRGEAGLVGLAFQPIHRNGPPDIVGTLWVDQVTAQLRYLEFRYSRIPMAGDLPTAPFGGRVEFRRLRNGDWIVQRWWLRMPQAVSDVSPAAGRASWLFPNGPEGRSPAALERRGIRIHEQGGEVRFIGAAGESGAEGRSELSGVVYDSTRSIPLARANVFLTDINRATTTDFIGHFRFDDLPAGTHRVAFTHPYADSLGLPVSPKTVVVDPNHFTSVTLTIPRNAACPDATPGVPPTAGIVGFVDDMRTGEPQPGVEVRITWWDYGKGPLVLSAAKRVAYTDTTDAQGRYLFCQLPLDYDIELAPTNGPAVVGPILELKFTDPGLVWKQLLRRRRGQ
jgi:hypothetical protein